MPGEERDRAPEEDDERPGRGPGPQSRPGDAGPPLTEDDGTETGTSSGTHEPQREPGVGGPDPAPRREEGGL